MQSLADNHDSVTIDIRRGITLRKTSLSSQFVLNYISVEGNTVVYYHNLMNYYLKERLITPSTCKDKVR